MCLIFGEQDLSLPDLWDSTAIKCFGYKMTVRLNYDSHSQPALTLCPTAPVSGRQRINTGLGGVSISLLWEALGPW